MEGGPHTPYHVTLMDSHPTSDECHVRVAVAKVLGLIGASNEKELRSITRPDFIDLLSAQLSELLRVELQFYLFGMQPRRSHV